MTDPGAARAEQASGLEEPAVVIRTVGRRVWVKSLQGGACGGCSRKSACGTAALQQLAPQKELLLESDMLLKPGDHVLVAVDTGQILLGSLLLYLVPLLAALAGVGLLQALLPQAAGAWLPEIFLALLLAGFALLHRCQGVLAARVKCRPRIVGKWVGS